MLDAKKKKNGKKHRFTVHIYQGHNTELKNNRILVDTTAIPKNINFTFSWGTKPTDLVWTLILAGFPQENPIY